MILHRYSTILLHSGIYIAGFYLLHPHIRQYLQVVDDESMYNLPYTSGTNNYTWY